MDLRAGISEKTDALIPALVAAQQAIRAASKSALNAHFGKSYADLGSVWSACRQPLTANGFCVTQMTDTDGERVVLISTLLHVSGQWIRSVYPVKPVKVDPQSYGSALTYARRYALASMVGVVAADEDDDAQAASEQAPQTRQVDNRSEVQHYANNRRPLGVDAPRSAALGRDEDPDDFSPDYGAPSAPESTWNTLVLELASANTCEVVEGIAARAKATLTEHEYGRFRVDAASRWELIANAQVAAQ